MSGVCFSIIAGSFPGLLFPGQMSFFMYCSFLIFVLSKLQKRSNEKRYKNNSL